jgi:hypothetical protein
MKHMLDESPLEELVGAPAAMAGGRIDIRGHLQRAIGTSSTS